LGRPLQHDSWVSAVAFSPDGTTLATASGDGTARLWRLPAGEPLGKPMQHGSRVRAVAFSPDGQMLFAATQWWVHASHFKNRTASAFASRLLPGA
ncbi:MAG: serine/threonine protein kinase, partial [Candidatus Tectomicrobia bacterium]